MNERIKEMRRLMRRAVRDGLLAPEAASELKPIIAALKRLGFRLIDEQIARDEAEIRMIDHFDAAETGIERDRRSEETWEELKALKFVLNRLIAEERAAAPF